MTKRPHTKFIREGRYAAEVDVHLIDSDEGWSPYLSLEDTEKLDEVRKALMREDLKRAAELARVFELIPVRNVGQPVFGSAQGLIEISEDFDAPLDEFRPYAK